MTSIRNRRNRKVNKKITKYQQKYNLYKLIEGNSTPIIVENAFFSIKSSILYKEAIPNHVKEELLPYIEILEDHLKELLLLFEDD